MTEKISRGVAGVCRKIGVFREDEFFDSETWKTKIIFWSSQFIYTVLTIWPVKFLFDSRALSYALLFVFTMAVWNGANYYFEVLLGGTL